MAAPLSQRIAERIPTAVGLYHQLVLVVGPPRTGKTTALRELVADKGWPLVNVNLALAERLLELTAKQRALRVARLLDQVAGKDAGGVLLLDNTEVLFSLELKQDPLRLLQGFARHRTVVATWAGECVGESLTYAAPTHPEYRRYQERDVVIVPTLDVQSVAAREEREST